MLLKDSFLYIRQETTFYISLSLTKLQAAFFLTFGLASHFLKHLFKQQQQPPPCNYRFFFPS